MSPPVQRDGKPVKNLYRRESSCVPFWLCYRSLLAMPSPFGYATHRSMGLRARALFAKLASHGLRGPCYGISFGLGRFELQGKSLGRSQRALRES